MLMATDAIGSDAIHIPVMRDRILELLVPALENGRRVHVDGTLGMGGHAEAVLRRFPDVQLVGIDRDQQALAMAGARLKPFSDRIHLVHAVHDELPAVLDDLGLEYADSVLLDLGLSSLHIDEVDRGFSYSVDSPLDMRMDQSTGRTAAQILNESDPGDLVRILREYGEEKFADRIVHAIVTERDRQPFETSGRLVEVITEAIPAAVRYKRSGHPAKRTFQALRIAVNREMDTLPAVLPRALDRLNVRGRIAVLAYHSLEDRLVKEVFRQACADTAPAGLPMVPESMAAQFSPITRGAERPDADEVSTNPRSASARLRVIERVRPRSGNRQYASKESR
ncbi:16S rRNA (cytosine(1402)-N(4))-methyltransferase RsmH [Cutibacterium sp. WCA-380-WT-3A]|uniref:Ribosomal RNA small subunit methyltransferase H n=1 Tax=Cutibacterium porci TaxID=2605781 RepID=A0A7K0J791_9ACTN|nr:16S rRNA (cytosine(1402)-N(4))-methyltransferase RsmH [Cutibacterium porci]MSS45836.1 16S rRNA (cytosine(1402)-N(4))-methyltransferase RsmH [Cutibacterium porci]